MFTAELPMQKPRQNIPNKMRRVIGYMKVFSLCAEGGNQFLTSEQPNPDLTKRAQRPPVAGGIVEASLLLSLHQLQPDAVIVVTHMSHAHLIGPGEPRFGVGLHGGHVPIDRRQVLRRDHAPNGIK